MKYPFIPAFTVGFALLLFWGTCSAKPPRQPAPVAYKKAVPCGEITSPKLSELSGLTVSRKTPGLLWGINDSGNPPEIYGFSTKGALLKTYQIEGAMNWDWEDLSGFRYKGEDFILIGDVGDNWSNRPFNTLYCVKEPKSDKPSGVLELQWQMNFRYENRPQDCEAMTVDAANQKIYLLSKRTVMPILYELPLDIPCKRSTYTAKAVAKISNPSKPASKGPKKDYGEFQNKPTAMDISTDGNTLYILTYRHAYAYSRAPKQTWDMVFSKLPMQISLPKMTETLPQREALGLDHTNGNLFISSEKLPAPIYMVSPIFPASHR